MGIWTSLQVLAHVHTVDPGLLIALLTWHLVELIRWISWAAGHLLPSASAHREL